MLVPSCSLWAREGSVSPFSAFRDLIVYQMAVLMFVLLFEDPG